MSSASANRIELEAKLIGCILLHSDALHELPANLTDAVFSQVALGRVFRAINQQLKSKRLPDGPLDPAVVCTWAGLEGDTARDMLDHALEAAEGCDAGQVASALLDQHRRAGAVSLLAGALDGFRDGQPAEETIARVSAGILDLDRFGAAEVSTAGESFADCIDSVEKCQVGGKRIVRTGFPALDDTLKIRPGNLIVLAARPAVGKTTFAFNWACNVAAYREPTEQGRKVLIHSLEMDRSELMVLALSRASGIDSQRFYEEQTLDAKEWDRVTQEGERIARNGNLLFNCQYPGLAPICAITRKQHRKHRLALVVVDYLQLVQNPKRNGTRENEVSEISRALKNLAQELQIPIVAVSQLNRESVKRDEVKRTGKQEQPSRPAVRQPKLHDLRESGAIEQDANAVVFLHNPNPESEDGAAPTREPFGVIVAKQRLGKRGYSRVLPDLEHAQFHSYQSTGPEARQGPTQYELGGTT
jgi:replicative DNA helicase